MKIAAKVAVSGFAGVMRRVAQLVAERAMQAGRSPKPRMTGKSKEPG
jgi:hypothetical protein